MAEQDPKRERKISARHRVIAWLDRALSRRTVQIIASAGTILAVALLIGPSPRGADSLLSELTLGRPAPVTVKANRSFPYMPGDETLRKKRAAAAEKVLPVFDYQWDRGVILLTRVNRAFEAVSAGLKSATGPRASAEELRLRFAEALQMDVAVTQFKPLLEGRFSADVRGAFLLMLGAAIDQFVVAHRGELKPFSGRPIIVRYLLGGRLSDRGEERLDNFSRIKDPVQIRAQIRHQANVHGARLSQRVRDSLAQLVERLVVGNANLTFNQRETRQRKLAAQEAILAESRNYVKGEVIVADGTPVTREHLRIIAAMESTSYRGVTRWQATLIGLCFVVSILLGVVYRFAGQHFRAFRLRPRDFLTTGILLLGLLALTRATATMLGYAGSRELMVYPYLLPIAAGAMLVRLLISAEAAALFAVICGALCGLAIEPGGNLGLMLYYLVTGLVGAAGMTQVQSRATVLRAGLSGGLIGALAVVGLCLIDGVSNAGSALYPPLTAIAGGVLASFMTLALLPALEWLLGYTTDVTLLELANLNHPLLRDLMLQAPGTYHHSMVVGSLSERACEAIGGNSLLAHVASNFHDVGKMKNAPYFAENFKGGENPHNRLKPSMSALIIRSHVKDTIEMLREHAVPDLVIDTATQHHGTSLVEFFYHKALQEKDPDEEVREEDYRYPGPKPQSREAGVIMLADVVEASVRSLADPTEDRLQAVVQRMINSKFTDGQLDQCDLTLRNLHLIAKSFLQVLRGIYHQRPSYPWQRETRAEDTTGRRVAEERKTGRRSKARGSETEPKSEKAPAEPQKARGSKKNKAATTGAAEPGAQAEPGGVVAPAAEAAEEAVGETPQASGPDIKRLGLN